MYILKNRDIILYKTKSFVNVVDEYLNYVYDALKIIHMNKITVNNIVLPYYIKKVSKEKHRIFPSENIHIFLDVEKNEFIGIDQKLSSKHELLLNDIIDLYDKIKNNTNNIYKTNNTNNYKNTNTSTANKDTDNKIINGIKATKIENNNVGKNDDINNKLKEKIKELDKLKGQYKLFMEKYEKNYDYFKKYKEKFDNLERDMNKEHDNFNQIIKLFDEDNKLYKRFKFENKDMENMELFKQKYKIFSFIEENCKDIYVYDGRYDFIFYCILMLYTTKKEKFEIDKYKYIPNYYKEKYEYIKEKYNSSIDDILEIWKKENKHNKTKINENEHRKLFDDIKHDEKKTESIEYNKSQ